MNHETKNPQRPFSAGCLRHWILFVAGLLVIPNFSNLRAAESAAAGQTYNVQTYVVGGKVLLATNALAAIFSQHTGTNVDLKEIVQTAEALQATSRALGHPEISIAVAPPGTNGVIVLNAFQAAIPQIVVFGKRYAGLSNEMNFASAPVAFEKLTNSVATAATNLAPAAPFHPGKPATPAEIVRARMALLQEMAELERKEKDHRVHVVSTNAGPRFEVEKYLVMGNSVLTPEVIAATLTNIDGAFGTNVSFDGIRAAVTELQTAYQRRGYVTVAVGLPQQKLTNATVKIQVTEGRLAAIHVKGNKYFSSDNVLRALPSLRTNEILNGQIFQAELNRANANQDRQIYPVVGPGPDPGTSELTLKVKDRLPLHAKEEFNNQSSPGTPDLRLNTSAVYNNLWQNESSFGVQYSFSPEAYKTVAPSVADLEKGSDWPFYDQPLVANYSAFYRLPLGNPEPVEDIVANNPNDFGYSEATRQFRLPAPTRQPDVTVFASRSTIDTGLDTLKNQVLFQTNNYLFSEKDVQQDLTVNNDLGFRLNLPLRASANFQSGFSFGADYKTYGLTSYKTNFFFYTATENDNNGGAVTYATNVTDFNSPVPITSSRLNYLPLALRYDGTLRSDYGITSFGLGLSVNLWYDSSVTYPSPYSANNTSGLQALRTIAGSQKSSGHWVTLTPSLTHVINLYTNWPLTLRADGQWASEPLINNEQFGIGGVNSVRGYHEGEAFGDTGWHFSLEQQTAPCVIGPVYANAPLTVRGSVYMDYGRVYLLDPQGRPPYTTLWDVGIGGVATIGSHWEARLLFSLPLRSTSLTQHYQPYFNFALTAQF